MNRHLLKIQGFWPAALRVTAIVLSLALLITTVPVGAATDGVLSPTTSKTATDNANSADVVVDLGDGRTLLRRVTFAEPAVSGLEALQLTGLDLGVAQFGFGAAVCSIQGVGCPVDDCFCDPDKYWGYQYWDGVTWQGYAVGAGDSSVSDGVVEGWVYGPFGDTPPPVTAELLAAEAALQWLRPRQAGDGGYGTEGATADVLLAVAAANHDPAAWRTRAGYSLVDYLLDRGQIFASRSPAAAGKLALAAAAAHHDPRDFGGVDLVAKLQGTYDPATGAYGTNNQDQAFALLGLRAAGEPIPPTAVRWLAGSANEDGGWGWTPGQVSDTDSTALALQALVAAGEPVSATAIAEGLAFLQAVQGTNDDGGFAHSPDLAWGTESNTNSTAFAIQGLLAAGEDPLSAAWSIDSTHPISYLLDVQWAAGGFPYLDGPADVFATQQAVPALVGKPHPYLSQAVAQRLGVAWIADQQQADGSFQGFNPGATIDAVLALVSAGRAPEAYISQDGLTALDYLVAQAAAYSGQGPRAAGKLAVGVVAAGDDPTSFGGVDLVSAIQAGYDAGSGSFGGGATWDQAWAILGLASSGQQIPPASVQRLQEIQAEGGGWGFNANAESADVDSTAVALQALAAVGAGRDDPAVQSGLGYLHTVQNSDGGFPGYLGATDASSTGLALQALAAWGENPRSLHWTRAFDDGMASRLTLHTPVEALMALQSAAGGFPGFGGPNDTFATYQAVPGLAGRPLPLLPLTRLYLPSVPGS